MIIPPSYDYSGLTVVLSNPSRFDIDHNTLMSGGGGAFFNNECLAPLGLSTAYCDIRTVNERTLREGTKAILLLGEEALHIWGGKEYLDYSINEQRGYLVGTNPTMIASYLPQDCADIVNWEGKLNPLLTQKDDEKEDKSAIGEKSRHGITNRANYGFWLIQDTRKLVGIIRNGIPEEPSPKYIIYPSSSMIIDLLRGTKEADLHFDIETNFPGTNITVFSIAYDNTIYTVPILRYDYSNAYNDLAFANIFRALSVSFSNNQVVIHNSLFDLLITAWRYFIPAPLKIYDTMLAFHRCFPEQEKSLGHVMSWGTYQPYHKDEGHFNPQNRQQEQQLWEYNAKDVYGLLLAKAAIEKFAEGNTGLQLSIQEGNRRIRPYLINTLFGIKYDEQRRQGIIKENDRLAMQYLRIIKLLCGTEVLPTSHKQCTKWFHEVMGYKPVKRTEKGNPSLDGDALYKLLLKNPENVSIKFFLKYRERIKETGSLKFTPFHS